MFLARSGIAFHARSPSASIPTDIDLHDNRAGIAIVPRRGILAAHLGDAEVRRTGIAPIVRRILAGHAPLCDQRHPVQNKVLRFSAEPALLKNVRTTRKSETQRCHLFCAFGGRNKLFVIPASSIARLENSSSESPKGTQEELTTWVAADTVIGSRCSVSLDGC